MRKLPVHFNARLSFNGQCQEAFRVYEQTLTGRITFMLTYGDAPATAATPEMHTKILHATLKVGDQRLTGVDVPPNLYEKPSGFAIQLNLEYPDDAARIFATLAEGGTIHMPLQKTFWAAQYALFTDRFGIPWEINCSSLPTETSV